jgi:signal transduction histidine kinase
VGLGFVRNVAESHGGSAMVYSSEVAGTEFRLYMPVDASPFVI